MHIIIIALLGAGFMIAACLSTIFGWPHFPAWTNWLGEITAWVLVLSIVFSVLRGIGRVFGALFAPAKPAQPIPTPTRQNQELCPPKHPEWN